MYAAVENAAGNVPAFLIKLWTLCEDPSTDELIYWDASGTSFHVFDQQRFSREILPLYFKHNNIASFIRQLNMYGFRKVTNIEQGGLKIERDDLQFQHQYFQKGERDMLQFIKRRVSNQAVRTTDSPAPSKADEVTRVLSEMKQVKVKQDSMDQNLEYIKRENKVLWREVAMLRQKHHKQQQIVNKLIQFLVSLVSSNRTGLTIPIRRAPLAINDVSQLTRQNANNSNEDALVKNETSPQLQVDPVSPSDIVEGFEDDQYTIESPKYIHGEYIIPSIQSDSGGPIIHELTDNVQNFLMPAEHITVVDPSQNQESEDLLSSILKSNEQVASANPVRNISVLPPIPHYVTKLPADPSSHLLMSPKIEAAPTLEDALNFGLNVPSSSGTVASNPASSLSALPQLGQGSNKRKRKSVQLPVTNTKRSSQVLAENAAKKQPPMSQSQATSLKNIVMANSDLNSNAQPDQNLGGSVANLAVTSSKDGDDFTISSDQLDLLSSDLDGLKGILQDQYKVDPAFLMELFESSNPWPLNQDKDFDDFKGDNDGDEASTSDNGNITGTELVEYNPRDDLFPELDDNIMGDIDDID